MSEINAIEMIHVRKAFGQTVALEDVSTKIKSGSVHAFLGENGAGKSTTVKMLSGLLQPDKGQLMLFNKEVVLDSPAVAHELGVQTAFQEMTQIPDLSVAQNLLIPYEPKNRFGLVDRKKSLLMAQEILHDLGLNEIDPVTPVGDLTLALRQKIEIARAVSRKPKILLLDEPTSALSGKDMEWLGGIIMRLKKQGTTIIFISHRMLEVRQYCDRISVLRNGKTVHEGNVADISDEDIVKLIIGRSLTATFPKWVDTTLHDLAPALEAKHLWVDEQLKDVSFKLNKGEVLGIAGLQGMGQLELFKACFGASLLTKGELYINGKKTMLSSPSDAIQSGVHLGFIPEDRKTEGLFMLLSGRDNISLSVINQYARFGLINIHQEESHVLEALEMMQVEQRGLTMPPAAFSGGNQQKMIMARWLMAKSKILLMYDPTRGVDIGTKAQIYKLIREFVGQGGSVLFYSTEIEEVVKISDRVVVVYKGQIATSLSHSDISEETIMEYALGHNEVEHA